MDDIKIYIAIALLVTALIVILLLFRPKKSSQKSFTLYTGMAYSLVLAGIIFWEERLLSYSLLGAGILLAVYDLIRKYQRVNQKTG